MPRSLRISAVIVIPVVAIVIGVILAVCSLGNNSGVDSPWAPGDNGSGLVIADIAGQRVNVKRYEIAVLDYRNLPQGFTDYVIPIERLDAIDGLPVVEIQGAEGYHPVVASCLLMQLLGSYVITEEPVYLEKALQISEMLLETGVYVDEALFFPYTFDFCLHGDCHELMQDPWYSGMAQGMALSAFVRLYRITEDEKYLGICRHVFNSLTRFALDEDTPWVVYVDLDGYYWIEEYPIQPPANTLNGFIFGIFGLYEYHLLVSDAETETVLQAAITTIERYISEFRRRGHLSLYCLKHEVNSGIYHRVHIDQLKGLYSVTEDSFFLDMADRFGRDTMAVLVFLRPGWRGIALSFLPDSVAGWIYSVYDSYQGFRQGRE